MKQDEIIAHIRENRRRVCEALRGGNYKQVHRGPMKDDMEHDACVLHVGVKIGITSSWRTCAKAIGVSRDDMWEIVQLNDTYRQSFDYIASYIESLPERLPDYIDLPREPDMVDYAANRKWIESVLPNYPYKAHAVFSKARTGEEREHGAVWACIMVSPTLKLYAYKDKADADRRAKPETGLLDTIMMGWPNERKNEFAGVDFSAITAEIIGRKY